MSPMPDLLRMHADASGDHAAVIVDEAGGGRPAAVTFGELNGTVNRLAHALRALGMQPGERLVWCGPNSLEVIATIHAARKAGQIAVPLSYRFNADEMQYVIDNSDATLVVVDAEQAPLVAEVRDRIPKVRAVIAFGGDVPPGSEAWEELLASQPDTDPEAKATAAKRICAGCQVRDTCRDTALAQPAADDTIGIYGGLTPAERAELRGHNLRQRAQHALDHAALQPRIAADLCHQPGLVHRLARSTERRIDRLRQSGAVVYRLEAGAATIVHQRGDAPRRKPGELGERLLEEVDIA